MEKKKNKNNKKNKLDKASLKRELKKLGINVVKGNYIKKSQVKMLIAGLTVKTTDGETATVDRKDLHNVGNTNGRDVKCKKCKEPYENLFVLEDFTDEEFENFVVMGPQSDDPHGEPTRIAALDGCPACGE